MPCPALRFEGSPARDCSSGRQCCKEPAEWPAQKTWGQGGHEQHAHWRWEGIERWAEAAEARSQRPCGVPPSIRGRL